MHHQQQQSRLVERGTDSVDRDPFYLLAFLIFVNGCCWVATDPVAVPDPGSSRHRQQSTRDPAPSAGPISVRSVSFPPDVAGSATDSLLESTRDPVPSVNISPGSSAPVHLQALHHLLATPPVLATVDPVGLK
jgi:hypothetical protein